MTTRKKPSNSKPTKKQLLMDRDRIRKEIEKEGAYRGGSSARKDLFIRPTRESGPIKVYMLPDLKERGPSGIHLPYFNLATHWVRGARDDGSPIPFGITCLRALLAEEPYAVKRLVEAKIGPFAGKKYEVGMIPEKLDLRCVPCDVLETFGDAIPRDQYGQKPVLSPQAIAAFQVATEAGALKILTITRPTCRSFMNLIFDDDLLELGHFEEKGVMAKFEYQDKSYGVTLLPNLACPLEGWQEKFLDIELMTPNFMPFEEQVQHMYTNLPGHFASELSHLFKDVEPPQVKAAPPKPKPSRVKSAR